MTKKRIRQMNAALLRRLSLRPAAEYLAGREETAAQLVGEGYFQRFAPLMDRRLCCARVLDLCREDLERLDGPEPEEGWLPYCYDFARRLLFPEKDARPAHGAGAVFFLSVLQVLLDAERELLDYDPAWDFVPPGPEELEDCPAALQFGQMMRLWRREFVYEMMRLGLEVTPYRTLEHIVGVHHVAVTAGRALRRGGVELDLALVSGSAIGHDIGKFGCRPGERVPYLHYYYTDQWFRRRRLTDIGHVAANHSVWDLELDYLSVESLLLIYADFRVKQTRDGQGREVTKIFSLAEAFNVILSKLDGVDWEKRRRYELVYARLYDFEQFMLARGVDVTLLGRDTPPRPEKHTALMTDQEALDALTMQCVGHNIGLMHRLTGQRSFASLLEQARGETNWRRLRAYLGVFESYSLYLHIPQKVQTLAFLYELLMHREGDIRRQAAALLGEIIAGFHAGYAKERPADSRPDAGVPTDLDQWKLYLQRIIYPDHKLMPQHQRWIRYTLKFAVDSLLQRCPGREERFLAPFFAYYRHPQQLEDEVAFQLLDTAAALPPAALTQPRQELLLRFAEGVCDREDVTVRAAAVLLVDRLHRLDSRSRRVPGPAAPPDHQGRRPRPPAGAGDLRHFPGQPENRHPLDPEAGEHPPAGGLRRPGGRPGAAHRHPSVKPGEGQRPGDGAPQRRKRPAGPGPPADGGPAQRGVRGVVPGAGAGPAGVCQVYPRLSGPVRPVAAAGTAGGAAGGPEPDPQRRLGPDGGLRPGHRGRDL